MAVTGQEQQREPRGLHSHIPCPMSPLSTAPPLVTSVTPLSARTASPSTASALKASWASFPKRLRKVLSQIPATMMSHCQVIDDDSHAGTSSPSISASVLKATQAPAARPSAPHRWAWRSMPPSTGRSPPHPCTWASWVCSPGPQSWPACTAQALSRPGQPATTVRSPDPRETDAQYAGDGCGDTGH